MIDFRDLYDLVPDSVFSHRTESPFRKLWNIYSERMNALRQIADEMYFIRDIEMQEGKILDLIGEIVREKRSGNDSEYKMMLMIAFAKLFCSGSIDSLQDILRSVAGDDFIGIFLSTETQDAIKLDGSWKLNGIFYLCGTDARAAFYSVHVKKGCSCINIINKILPLLKIGGIGFWIVEV